jgi:hypothetical protein
MAGSDLEEVFKCCNASPVVRYRETSKGDIIEFWVACDDCEIEGFSNPLMWEAIKGWNDMLYTCDIIYKEMLQIVYENDFRVVRGAELE